MSNPPVQLAARRSDAHKGSFGRTLLVGGSRGMAGSIALASMASLHTGSGLVTAAVPDRCLESVAAFHPSIMTMPFADDSAGAFAAEACGAMAEEFAKPSAIGCGPGMGTGAGSTRIVERLLERTTPARVLDADAVNILAQLYPPPNADSDAISLNAEIGCRGTIVLTPHPGEFQRLSGVSAKDRDGQIKAAESLTDRTGFVIVLKGGPTVVVGPGEVFTNDTGNPGMATAGAGDVLTGVITSLLGQGLSGWDAARLGVWVHGLAGDLAAQRLGQAGMTSREILEALPEAMKSASGT